MDNFFTNFKLLEKNVFATGIIRANKMEKAPLSGIKEMEKKPKGTHKVIVDINPIFSTITNQWFIIIEKTIKSLLLLQHTVVLLPLVKQSSSHAYRQSIDMPQTQVVKVYNTGM